MIFSLLTNAIDNDAKVYKNLNYSNFEDMVLINGLDSVTMPKPECQQVEKKTLIACIKLKTTEIADLTSYITASEIYQVMIA